MQKKKKKKKKLPQGTDALMPLLASAVPWHATTGLTRNVDLKAEAGR